MIFELAIKILPVEKRSEYAEEWAEVDGSWPEGKIRRRLHSLDFLRASISIRLQDNPWNYAAGVLVAIALLTLCYLSSWFARDFVIAIIFLVMRRLIDFRQRFAAVASFVTTIHFILVGLVVSLFAIIDGLLPNLDNNDALVIHFLKSFLACVAACSVVAALLATVLWLADAVFASHRTLLFRAVSLFFVFALGTYWLFEISSYLSTIGALLVPNEVAAELSRIQQRTTNLILPVGLTLATLWFITYRDAKRHAKSNF